MAKLESLIVDIQANTAQLQKGLDAANERLKKMDQFMAQLTGAFVLNKLGAAALDAAQKLGAFVAKGIESLDTIGKQATLYGETAEEFSRLSYAFAQGGVDADAYSKATQGLSKNLSAVASGAKEQTALFKALGVAALDSSGNVRKTSDVIKDLSAKFANMKDSPAKAQLAIELFGKGGEALVETLSKGRDGIAELEAEADKFGATVSGNSAAAAAQFNDSMTQLSSAVDSVGHQLAAAVLPQLNLFVEKVKSSETLTSAFTTAVDLLGTSLRGMAIMGTVAVAALDGMINAVKHLSSAIGLFVMGFFDGAKKEAEAAKQSYFEMGQAMKKAFAEAANPPKVAGSAPKKTGVDASAVLRASKQIADGMDLAKKHAEDVIKALLDLSKVAEDYERKVATFGSNDPTAELAYRLDKGDLAEKLELLGENADKMRERIMSAAKALADLNNKKFMVDLQFNVEQQSKNLASQNADRQLAYEATKFSAASINKKLTQGFTSRLQALDAYTHQMEMSFQFAADAARASKDNNQDAEHQYKDLQRSAEESAKKASLAADAYASIEQSAKESLKKVATGVGSVMTGFVSKLGDLGDVMQAGIQGFQQGGPWVALFAVIMELFSRFKGFGEIIDIANRQLGQFIEMLTPAFEMLATAFKAIMEFSGTLTQIIIRVLTPVIEIISRVLTKVFTALQPIVNVINMVVEVLSPIFDAFMALVDALDPFQFAIKIIAVVFNVVGLVLLGIARVVVGIAQGVLAIVKSISDVFGGNKGIDKAYNDVNAAASNIEDKMKKLAQNIGNPDAIGSGNVPAEVDNMEVNTGHSFDVPGVDKLDSSASGAAAAINEFSNSLTNVPQGFRYAASVYNAQGLSPESVYNKQDNSGREDITLLIDGEKLAEILRRGVRKDGFRKTGRKGDEFP